MRTQISRRNRTACSILALATVLTVGATPAAAQVAGSGSFAVGSGTINAGAGSVTLDSSRSVINWNSTGTVTNGVNQFLAPGNTLTFNGAGNFAVLNRVSTGTDMLGLNGTVNGGQGSIYFYNPNGIVVGGSSIFNVGSLVLTTLDITDANFASGSTTIGFNQAANPLSSVTVNALAQINASGSQSGSYVALVAPRVVHNGTINVDGSAALVAAEAATITFSPNGLFTITTDVGTTDSQGVVIDGGTITGPASSGSADNHRIYAVAVPKNDALTMTITGGAQLGFDIAGAANVAGNTVILTAGGDVFGSGVATSPAAGAPASISIDNSDFSSATYAEATGNISLTASNSNVDIASDFTAIAGGNIYVNSIGDALISVTRDLYLSTSIFNVAEGADAQAGDIVVSTEQFGSLFVGGDVSLYANATGGHTETAGLNSGTGRGGNIYFQSTDGGSISVVGGVYAEAVGHGGDVYAANANGGTGTGGQIGRAHV